MRWRDAHSVILTGMGVGFHIRPQDAARNMALKGQLDFGTQRLTGVLEIPSLSLNFGRGAAGTPLTSGPIATEVRLEQTRILRWTMQYLGGHIIRLEAKAEAGLVRYRITARGEDGDEATSEEVYSGEYNVVWAGPAPEGED